MTNNIIEHIMEMAAKGRGDPHAMISAICAHILEKEEAEASSFTRLMLKGDNVVRDGVDDIAA